MSQVPFSGIWFLAVWWELNHIFAIQMAKSCTKQALMISLSLQQCSCEPSIGFETTLLSLLKLCFTFFNYRFFALLVIADKDNTKSKFQINLLQWTFTSSQSSKESNSELQKKLKTVIWYSTSNNPLPIFTLLSIAFISLWWEWLPLGALAALTSCCCKASVNS